MSELCELKQLREENRKLRGLVADLTLHKQILRASLTKKILRPAKRAWVRWVTEAFQVSGRRAIRATGVASSTMHYKYRWPSQNALRARGRRGARQIRLFVRLRLAALRGLAREHKRVYRLYREEGLALQRRRPERRRAAMPRSPRREAMRPKKRWAMDFIQDVLADGCTVREFTLVNAHTRECLALEAAPRFLRR